ncbi:hypothetical protein M8756_03430 [Lutimaribacter sp. EGI FJ00015]|nr:hypothetical protein [Lutimaribacter sp. EGI FJ00015]MCO0634531.1 hypothetical protein [Lutimaribacter sp. EGI FJ00014]
MDATLAYIRSGSSLGFKAAGYCRLCCQRAPNARIAPDPLAAQARPR